MKKVALLPLAALAFAACADTAESPMAPVGPQLELVAGHGTTVTNPTVDVYGSFSITVGGGTISVLDYAGVGINEEGKAIGTCANGRWTNPAGKQTGGLIHQHCVRGAAAASSPSQTITLESIAGKKDFNSRSQLTKLLLEENDLLYIQYNGSSDRNDGQGVLVAYGSKDGVRYGKFVIDLNAFDTGTGSGNLLTGRCYIGEETTTAARIADTANWRDCLAPTNSDGEIVADANGNYSGKVTAKFYHEVNADHTTVSPDNTVYGYLYWVTR